jgi:hypothetical protein
MWKKVRKTIQGIIVIVEWKRKKYVCIVYRSINTHINTYTLRLINTVLLSLLQRQQIASLASEIFIIFLFFAWIVTLWKISKKEFRKTSIYNPLPLTLPDFLINTTLTWVGLCAFWKWCGKKYYWDGEKGFKVQF